MLSPWIIGFVGLFAVPMIISLLLAFTEWDLVSAPKWVGFSNFVTMFHDPNIRASLVNTAFYAFISTPLYACIGLVLALALYKRIPRRKVVPHGLLHPVDRACRFGDAHLAPDFRTNLRRCRSHPRFPAPPRATVPLEPAAGQTDA